MNKRNGIRIRNYYIRVVIITLCVGLCLGLSFFAIFSLSNIYNNKKENLSSADAFIKAITENSISANTNAEYHLTHDIILTSLDLDKIYCIKNQAFETGAFFYGKLYGHGYIIRIDGIITAPIFKKICEGAMIEGINFECGKMQITYGVNELALLVKDNYGTISDIAITGIEKDAMLIDFNNEKPTAVSALCIRNHENGKISHCAVKVEIKTADSFCQGENKLIGDNKWSCYFGAIAAYCKVGEMIDGDSKGINGVRVMVNFAYNFTPLLLRRYTVNNDTNNSIGYFIGSCNDFERIGNESFYLIDGIYKDNVIDFCNLKNKLCSEEDPAPKWTHWNETELFQIDKY